MDVLTVICMVLSALAGVKYLLQILRWLRNRHRLWRIRRRKDPMRAVYRYWSQHQYDH